MGKDFNRGCVMMLLGIMLLVNAQNGALALYVATRFTPLVLTSAAGLLIIGLAQLASAWLRMPQEDRSGTYRTLLIGLQLAALLVIIHQPAVWGVLIGILLVPVLVRSVHLSHDSPFAAIKPVKAVTNGLELGAQRLHMSFESKPIQFDFDMAVICIPLVLGLIISPQFPSLLIPAKALSAGMADAKGPHPPQPEVNLANAAQGRPNETQNWSLLDWNDALGPRTLDPQPLIGKSVSVTGFVFHRPGEPSIIFHIGQFVVTGSVADAMLVELPVRWGAASKEVDNTWVNVTGVIGAEQVSADRAVVVMGAKVVPLTPLPPDPYLHP